ncbi:MAG TPA: hypothetical protein PKD05_18095 [Candidatus Melainabacteria bacterium]|nr:hypothetical protein [Candidatus Melainabacteria bacterium]HMP53465.1 hypothetical protein [Candidatus Melainabacteria bacterium]
MTEENNQKRLSVKHTTIRTTRYGAVCVFKNQNAQASATGHDAVIHEFRSEKQKMGLTMI